MRRELIVVVGEQGYGKSVWTQLYADDAKRLFVSDLTGMFRNVDFETPPEDFWPRVKSGELATFRFGSYHASELDMFGNFAFAAGRCTYVIEECALLFERGAKLEEWANRLIFMGRHPEVNLILVAQRANKIPLDIRSQASRIITFRQAEPQDADTLSDKIGREHFEEIMQLPELECLDWQGRGTVKRYAVRP